MTSMHANVFWKVIQNYRLGGKIRNPFFFRKENVRNVQLKNSISNLYQIGAMAILHEYKNLIFTKIRRISTFHEANDTIITSDPESVIFHLCRNSECEKITNGRFHNFQKV